MSRPGDERHVVLVGMMGVGKTTVGTLLAERLGRPFLDSDQVIEARAGRTIRDIFETDGEAVGRDLETEVFRDALASPTPSVIATGGGIVIRAENRAELRSSGALVVWLSADTDVLDVRVRDGDHRPLLHTPEGATAVLARLASERRDWYAEVATCSIEADHLTPEQVVDRIVEVLDG